MLLLAFYPLHSAGVLTEYLSTADGEGVIQREVITGHCIRRAKGVLAPFVKQFLRHRVLFGRQFIPKAHLQQLGRNGTKKRRKTCGKGTLHKNTKTRAHTSRALGFLPLIATNSSTFFFTEGYFFRTSS